MKYFLGGDVSKGYCDWTLLDENKKIVLENFQLDDTFDGHCQLHEILEKFFNQQPNAEIFAAVESTGGYENNWYNTLISFQITFEMKVARVNPRGVNFNRKAGLGRIVTDAISAYHIAEYLINHSDKVDYANNQQWKALRRHWNFAELQKKQKTQLINQLETLLYTANPTLMQYKQDNFPNWLMELILLCPSADKLKKASPKKLSKIPYLSEQKAKEIIAEAQNNVASAIDADTEELIRQIVGQIQNAGFCIKTQMTIIEKSLNIPEIELLQTFDGIGITSAIGLMLEIGNIHRFKKVKSFCCFFGLHPKF